MKNYLYSAGLSILFIPVVYAIRVAMAYLYVYIISPFLIFFGNIITYDNWIGALVSFFPVNFFSSVIDMLFIILGGAIAGGFFMLVIFIPKPVRKFLEDTNLHSSSFLAIPFIFTFLLITSDIVAVMLGENEYPSIYYAGAQSIGSFVSFYVVYRLTIFIDKKHE